MADIALSLWIRNVRRRAGFPTQAAFADELGVSRGAVGNWESGRGKPTMAHAERFGVVTNRSRAEVMARLGYPIGGGEPAPVPALPAEWLSAIEAAVAAGVAEGIAAALADVRSEGQPPAGGPRRRRSA